MGEAGKVLEGAGVPPLRLTAEGGCRPDCPGRPGSHGGSGARQRVWIGT